MTDFKGGQVKVSHSEGFVIKKVSETKIKNNLKLTIRQGLHLVTIAAMMFSLLGLMPSTTHAIAQTSSKPDLTATKTHSGSLFAGDSFIWKIRVANSGTAAATFNEADVVLQDNMPFLDQGTYGAVTVSASGNVTGLANLSCSQSGMDGADLVCQVKQDRHATLTVVIPVSGYIDFSVVVKPQVAGTLTNPRSASRYDSSPKCMVDPGAQVTESNENNNTCSDALAIAQPKGTLKIVKVVKNQHGGTATPDQFSFSVNNGKAQAFDASGETDLSLVPGTYSVSEVNDDSNGYEASYNNCSRVHLDAGETITCTITNTDQPARLIVIKHVVGGKARSGDFTMNVSGGNVSKPSFPGADFFGTWLTLNAGEFSVSESGGPDNYIQSTKGDCRGNIALGQTKTCLIINTYQAPTPTTTDLSIAKTVDNNTPAEGDTINYTLIVTNKGPADDSNVVVTDNLPNGLTFVSASPSGAYDPATGIWTVGTVANGDVDNLTITAKVASGFGGATISNTASVSGDLGETDTENNTAMASLTVKPVMYTLSVVKDGTGTGTINSSSETISCGSACSDSFASGTQVTLTAVPDSGSTFAGWSGACSGTDNCTVVMNQAQAVTATFNTTGGGGGGDNGNTTSGTLTLTETVVGGTATSADFSLGVLDASLANVINSPQSGSNTGTLYTLTAGTYTINQTGPSGYVTTYSDGCSGGTVTVVANASSVCTITNTWSLVISNEQKADASQNNVTISWTTNHPATSRVIYDTVSHGSLSGEAPNYGYAYSTVEDAATTTSHSVVISGLTAGTTYYFRPVSHGSPEVVGAEVSVQTSATDNSVSTGSVVSSSVSGGGSSSPAVSVAPVGEVLGTSTVASLPVPQGEVLGTTTTLPRTGMPVTATLLIFLTVAAVVDRKFKLI